MRQEHGGQGQGERAFFCKLPSPKAPSSGLSATFSPDFGGKGTCQSFALTTVEQKSKAFQQLLSLEPSGILQQLLNHVIAGVFELKADFRHQPIR